MTNEGATKHGEARTKLAVVGDTVHHVDDDGRLWTHAALASQLDLWFAHFTDVTFAGVLEAGPPPPGFAPYQRRDVSFVALPHAGGTGIRAKLGVLRALVDWIRLLVPLLRSADAVHLRTPCNVTIPGLILARLLAKNRYAIFAGSWHAYKGEPASYKLQRWLERRWFGGVVHAYIPPTESPDRPNLRPGFSPVLSTQQLDALTASSQTVRAQDNRPLTDRPIRIVSVGRFSVNKNQIVLVEALRLLQSSGTSVECHFIGDGSELRSVKIAAANLTGVSFTAHAGRTEVFDAMQSADLNVLPSFREGYPKVLLEGMSAGALPIAADTPVNRAMTEGRGWVFDPASACSLARLVEAIRLMNPSDLESRRERCTTYAHAHTLDAFASEVQHIVKDIWSISSDLNVSSPHKDSRPDHATAT